MESPVEEQGSTMPLPWRNHFGDSRAERENDMLDLGVYVVTAEEPAVGFFGRLRFPLNDSR